MSRPIVIAHHLIWTVYGSWLPNDPRGSMSRTIRNDVLRDLGELHHGRKEVQPASRDIRAFYRVAAAKLQHPILEFDPPGVRALGGAFAAAVREHRYTCYACTIMPDHVHVLIRKHRHLAEEMIAHLQDATRRHARACGLRAGDHPVWGGPGWKVFLDSPADVRRTIKYIEDNPLPWRMPKQVWDFVTPYNDWPFHPGHSPNSPYVRRMGGRYNSNGS